MSTESEGRPSASNSISDGASYPGAGGEDRRRQDAAGAAERLRAAQQDALKSPKTSVTQLLADTNAAPPQAKTQRQTGSVANGQASKQDEVSKNVSFADVVKGRDAPASGPASSYGPANANRSVAPRDQAAHGAPGGGREKPSFQATLQDLRHFLMPFLRLLPFQSLQGYLKMFLGPFVRFIVKVVATILHRWDFGLASNLAYDLHLLLWKWVINLFFREIRPRGAYKVPRSGPVLFVCGPHHNQFLDPLLLMSEVRLSANRRVSFLIAEKSYHRSFIGLAAKIAHSIPVARAADNAFNGKGKLYLLSGGEDDIIKGMGSNFTKELKQKSQVQLPKEYGSPSVEVVEVIDDETIKVKKLFSKERAVEDLVEAGKKIKAGDREAGIKFKCLPYIDQTRMYSEVYKKLSQGGCIGIFPEGGSHDRTDFLPLKHGLAIMALGAMVANPNLKVQIVPVGLNYFHAHRFRSRAVIEFGNPIDIPPETVSTFAQGGQAKRDAVGSIMDLVFDGLKSVTVRAPDYETLMVIQASRRLYKPPGQQLNLSQVVDLNKKFIMGYNAYRDEPKVKDLYKKVEAYNRSLRQLGIKDHQVEGAIRPVWKSFLLLLWRLGLISAWTVMALPGIIMNAPIFILASTISRKKAKEALAASTVKVQARDVLATWKVLVSLGTAPILYGIYTAITMYCVFKYDLGRKYLFLTPLFMLVAVPSFGYSALRFGEVGMDIYKSLPPLFMSMFPWHYKQLEKIRQQRREVAAELTETIEEFAPKLWADFEKQRMIPHSATEKAYSAGSQPGSPGGTSLKRRSTFGAESSILQHPMSWIDEKIFGWSTRASRMRWGSDESDNSGHTPAASEPVTPGWRTESEDDPADYDDVVRAVREKLEGEVEEGSRPRRRSGSGRSKNLGFTEMTPGGTTTALPESQGNVEKRAVHTADANDETK